MQITCTIRIDMLRIISDISIIGFFRCNRKRREIAYFDQTATTIERIIANACDAVRNCDARQTATIAERIIANACDAVRNRDACKPATTVERIIANACNNIPGGRFRRNDNVGIGASADT